MSTVLEAFNALKQYTDISEEEKETAVELCTNALEDISSRLKRPDDASDRRVIAAAGAQAYYMLCI